MEETPLRHDVENPGFRNPANIDKPPKLDFRPMAGGRIIFRAILAEGDVTTLRIQRDQQIFDFRMTAKRAGSLTRWFQKVYIPWAERQPNQGGR